MEVRRSRGAGTIGKPERVPGPHAAPCRRLAERERPRVCLLCLSKVDVPAVRRKVRRLRRHARLAAQRNLRRRTATVVVRWGVGA